MSYLCERASGALGSTEYELENEKEEEKATGWAMAKKSLEVVKIRPIECLLALIKMMEGWEGKIKKRSNGALGFGGFSLPRREWFLDSLPSLRGSQAFLVVMYVGRLPRVKRQLMMYLTYLT